MHTSVRHVATGTNGIFVRQQVKEGAYAEQSFLTLYASQVCALYILLLWARTTSKKCDMRSDGFDLLLESY